MCSQGAGVPPAGIQKSGKQAKWPMFSVISRQPWTPLPGVRHPAAPGRKASGWRAEEYLTQSPPRPQREREGVREGVREERTHAEARSAWRTILHKRTKRKQRGGWRAGGRPTLKTMKTASRTWKGGRDTDGQPERGRPAREASEKRKTSENAYVFSVVIRSLEREREGVGLGLKMEGAGWDR